MKNFSTLKLMLLASSATSLNAFVAPLPQTAVAKHAAAMGKTNLSFMHHGRRSTTTATRGDKTGLFLGKFLFQERNIVGATVGGIALILLISAIQVIGSSEIGIVSTFGELNQLDPGIHVIAPIASSLDRLSTKTQLLEQSNFVPTKEGLTVELDTAILYKIDPKSALDLYRSVGKNYAQTIVAPQSSSVIRGLTAESEAKALYTSGRSEIQNKIKNELEVDLIRRGVVVEDVLLKAIQLPQDLSKSIEEKARAEQDSARMEFVLAKEKQEAERKAIEAQGIADFQRIVSTGISPNLLRWKGIEATEKLAESPNSKIVVVGSGKDGLPLILGGGEK